MNLYIPNADLDAEIKKVNDEIKADETWKTHVEKKRLARWADLLKDSFASLTVSKSTMSP